MAFKMNGFSAFTKQTGDKKKGKMWSKKQLLNMKKNLKDYKKIGWMGSEDLYQHKDSLSTGYWPANLKVKKSKKHKDTGFDLKSK